MDRDRHRRFITILLLCLVYIVSTYLQSIILDQIEATSSDIIRSAKSYAAKSIKTNRNEGNRKPNFKGDLEDARERNHLEDDFSRIPKVYVELRTCLPRFICEVHAQAPGMGGTSDLEKDVLSLFSRNYVFLEGPGSPIYSYQLAAHMGQLAAGLIPSPCHNMYPSCPLSRQQLLELLSGVRTTRSSFF